MQKEEIRIRIKEYLNANDKPCEDIDIDNYIYLSAYNKLMVDMYGANPFDKLANNTSSNISEVATDNEKKQINIKSGNMLNGKISITKK